MQMLVLCAQQPGQDRFAEVNRRLSERLLQIKQRNPRGWADQWDQQVDTIGCDVAQAMGGNYTYRDGKDHVLIFTFPPMSPEGAERYLDEHPELWKN